MAKGAKPTKPKAVTPPQFDDYWQLRMQGATSRLQAAQQIVSHPGTRGTLAENLLREMIRDFLPQRWAVCTGFIMDAATNSRSNQVDLLIYDQLNTSPIFRDGELVVLPPRSARIVVEVKSQLDANHIPKAYNNVCSVRRIDPNVLGFIFGYNGVAADTFSTHVKDWAAQADAPGREYWPDQVFNMEQQFLVLGPKAVADRTDPKREFVVVAGKDPVVRMFLTATLTAIGLTELRAFFRKDETGDKLLQL
jgi:hypothetical protein